MATGTTTYGDISQRTATWAAQEMLEHARPIIVLGNFGSVKPIPKNKADNVKFRRPVPFTVSTTPLVEGVTPAAKTMAYEDVSVKLEQYGDVHTLTDKVADLNEDPVLSDMTMLSGEQAGETIEMVTYGVVKGGTNVAYANGAGRTAVNTVVTLGLLRGAVRNLESNRAKRITKILAPSVNVETKPVEAGYIAFCHSDCANDIRNIAGFTPVAQYGSRQPLHERELGSVEDIRFITSPLFTPWASAGGSTSTMISTNSSNADVYPILIVSQDSFATTPLRGQGSISPIVLNPGTPSKSDPLGQTGFVGWKTWFAALILNEAWMIRLEVACTDL